MQIVVSYNDYATTFIVEASVSVRQLKSKIASRIGIPLEWQIVKFQRNELGDNRTLLSYDIKEQAILCLQVKSDYQENMNRIVVVQKKYDILFKKIENFSYLGNNRNADNEVEIAIRNLTGLQVEGEQGTINTPSQLKEDFALKEYQKEALTFMVAREKKTTPGGILADDMGLGKTLEMISLIVHQKQFRLQQMTGNIDEEDIARKLAANTMRLIPSNTTLIVAPKSVLKQWADEIEKFVKENFLEVEIFISASGATPENLACYDVVIGNYEAIYSKLGIFENIAFERIVLDEAHKIKNRDNKMSQAMCSLASVYRWCVTGTPVHNSIWDVYSLIRFIRVKPYMYENQWKQRIESENTTENERHMGTLMSDLMLRRTKDQRDHSGKPLVVLPQREFVQNDLRMEGDEKQAYKALFNALQNSDIVPIARMTHLRTACLHMPLVKDLVQSFVENKSCQQREVLRGLEHVFNADFMPGKMKEIIRIVERVNQENEKIVIVSGRVTFLKALQSHMTSFSLTKITGEINDEEREKALDEFNNETDGPTVMLLSLRAGGVGLNLVKANHLIVADPDWNPAMEAQAFDRIYRVGQTKETFVHRLIYSGTVEDRVITAQDRKKALSEQVLRGSISSFPREEENENGVEHFTEEEAEFILGIRESLN